MKTRFVVKLMTVAVAMGMLMGIHLQTGWLIDQAFAEDDKKPEDRKPQGKKPQEQKPEDQAKPERFDPFKDLNPKDKALFKAIKKKDLAAVQAAVDDGADVNVKTPGNVTALILAVRTGPDIVKYLLEKKADPNVIGNNGITALAIAKKNNLEDIVKMLTDAGAKE